MPDKKKLREQLIQNNPNDSATKLLDKAKGLKISNRKSDFLAEVRNIRKLPEPSKQKKEQSIPIIHRKVKPKVAKPSITKIITKPPKIPFNQTKFGKMVKTAQTKFGVDEANAIIYTRKILKIPKIDYDKLDQVDRDILTHYGY